MHLLTSSSKIFEALKVKVQKKMNFSLSKNSAGIFHQTDILAGCSDRQGTARDATHLVLLLLLKTVRSIAFRVSSIRKFQPIRAIHNKPYKVSQFFMMQAANLCSVRYTLSEKLKKLHEIFTCSITI